MCAARDSIISHVPCYRCGGVGVYPVYDTEKQSVETLKCSICNGTGYIEHTSKIEIKELKRGQ